MTLNPSVWEGWHYFDTFPTALGSGPMWVYKGGRSSNLLPTILPPASSLSSCWCDLHDRQVCAKNGQLNVVAVISRWQNGNCRIKKTFTYANMQIVTMLCPDPADINLFLYFKVSLPPSYNSRLHSWKNIFRVWTPLYNCGNKILLFPMLPMATPYPRFITTTLAYINVMPNIWLAAGERLKFKIRVMPPAWWVLLSQHCKIKQS